LVVVMVRVVAIVVVVMEVVIHYVGESKRRTI